MTKDKYKDIEFNFPEDPLDTDFMRMWLEFIESSEFKTFKKFKEECERENETKRFIQRDTSRDKS